MEIVKSKILSPEEGYIRGYGCELTYLKHRGRRHLNVHISDYGLLGDCF